MQQDHPAVVAYEEALRELRGHADDMDRRHRFWMVVLAAALILNAGSAIFSFFSFYVKGCVW